MTAGLGSNEYGKSGIRLATVARDGGAHHFTDLEIDVRLEGDFAAAHTAGDNSSVLPTDTMRGTCYALARELGTRDVAAYGLALADRFLDAAPAVVRARVELVAFGWEHLPVDDAPHPHTFRPTAGGQQLTTVARSRGGAAQLTGGVRGFRILKSTGSAFSGFLRDEYTTLPETRDRIMATTVVARWGYTAPEVEHGRLSTEIPATFGTAFARHDESESVQHTLHAMGTAVIDAHPEVAWITFRMPNEHHILMDLAPYGLDNPNEVFLVADKPFGVIEGTVVREGHEPESTK